MKRRPFSVLACFHDSIYIIQNIFKGQSRSSQGKLVPWGHVEIFIAMAYGRMT